jgi:hypothetical protein
MEGFKKLPKQIACFREGGSVQKEVHNFTKRDRKNVEPGDLAQDKKLIKKAFKQHDAAEHDKEPTEIKLKKGGRAKKEKGTVKKFCGGGNAYKEGGSVTNVYEAKKKSGDISNIEKVKDIKPGKAAAPSKAAVKPNFFGSDVEKEKSKPAGEKDMIKKVKPTGNKKAAAPSGAKGPDAYKKGGKVKKMATGGATFETDPVAAQAALDTQDNIATRNMIMNPARKAKKYLMDKLSGLSPMNAAVSNIGTPVPMPSAPQGPQTAPMPQTQPVPQGVGAGTTPMKKGGKAKKACK